MKTKAELPDCPVATTVSLIGSKWKLLILRNLLVRPWRFNELRKSLDDISDELAIYHNIDVPRVEYALSDLGESMRPIIKSMEEFGTGYKEQFEK